MLKLSQDQSFPLVYSLLGYAEPAGHLRLGAASPEKAFDQDVIVFRKETKGE
ncbi:hypothetical protein [Singulisphaera sp. PoT]|uniref:hypothetical protein n=1 Tax=Singulisphaera sp. PoT TaxID=3411797 RepID=UPI003BF4D679